jgi:hypothetical protein
MRLHLGGSYRAVARFFEGPKPPKEPLAGSHATHRTVMSRLNAALVILFGTVGSGWLVGCEQRPSLEKRFNEARNDTATASAAAPSPKTSASAVATASAPPQARRMPPRPLPLGSSGPIQPTAPVDQQMKTSQYIKAMAAAQTADPFVDEAALEGMVNKLAPLVSAAGGKTSGSAAHSERDGRIIGLNMARGCTAKMPKVLLSRAGLSLQDVYGAGVMVVKCHDKKWACHQATRVPEDVLCHAAPRRRRR